jgi:hypothetical protein
MDKPIINITDDQRRAITLEIEKRIRAKLPAMVEIEKGQENNLEHLKKLTDLKEYSRWKGGSPYVIEVILNHDNS